MTGTVVPGLVATTIETSESLSVTGRPLNSTMTSPRLQAGLGRRAARSTTVETSAPFAVRQAEGLRHLLRQRIGADLTPMTPRVTLPVRSCGSRSRMVLIGVAKPMPMFAERCGIGVDRGVHADDLAADVEQRTAGVAGVDRRVGLQHGCSRPARTPPNGAAERAR